ncbi:MAG: hypothetical protein HPY52_10630 [Firmicutes bacterium]|nr:hypothetical protein [Bacillota bacterium]
MVEVRRCGECSYFDWDDYDDDIDGNDDLGNCMCPEVKFKSVCPDWYACDYFIEADEEDWPEDWLDDYGYGGTD